MNSSIADRPRRNELGPYPQLVGYHSFETTKQPTFVVLMTEPKSGVVVYTSDITAYSVGTFRCDWSAGNDDGWKPYDGTVTISN